MYGPGPLVEAKISKKLSALSDIAFLRKQNKTKKWCMKSQKTVKITIVQTLKITEFDLLENRKLATLL